MICPHSAAFFLAPTESQGSASGKGVTQATLVDETKVASWALLFCTLLDELALHLWPIWISASDLLCSEMQLLHVQHLIWDHHWESSLLKVRERLKPAEEKRDYFYGRSG